MAENEVNNINPENSEDIETSESQENTKEKERSEEKLNPSNAFNEEEKKLAKPYKEESKIVKVAITGLLYATLILTKLVAPSEAMAKDSRFVVKLKRAGINMVNKMSREASRASEKRSQIEDDAERKLQRTMLSRQKEEIRMQSEYELKKNYLQSRYELEKEKFNQKERSDEEKIEFETDWKNKAIEFEFQWKQKFLDKQFRYESKLMDIGQGRLEKQFNEQIQEKERRQRIGNETKDRVIRGGVEEIFKSK
jgi:hypothetical protein